MEHCAGHLHCQATAGKQNLSDARPPVSPDISRLSPELQQQWHAAANMHLGDIKVKPYSRIRAVWQCNMCPAGQPHIWTAIVNNRTARGAKCPYCANKFVCLHNSLATIAPDVAKYWNHNKNHKSPEQVVAGSRFRAEWKCSTCKWEWQAPVSNRTHRRAGCPRCSQNSKSLQSHSTFAEAKPACLAEWDHERNEEDGLYPHEITLGSNKLVHWICACCPRGQPHRWRAMPNNRIQRDSGCAVCFGQQACLCNSLEALVPSAAAEFDVEKNGFAPSQISACSGKRVWWRNATRGSWQAVVDDHVDNHLRP